MVLCVPLRPNAAMISRSRANRKRIVTRMSPEGLLHVLLQRGFVEEADLLED
jgi:hypothetical protein